jgi:hypothetical protein
LGDSEKKCYFANQSTFNCRKNSPENINFMLIQNRRPAAIALIIALLLFVPFVAMQFTREVDWDLFDFAIAALLLSGTGLLIELVLRKVKTAPARLVLCGVVLLVLFLVWAELAVGIFGSAIAGS